MRAGETPDRMRAVEVPEHGGPGVLRVADRPVPDPGPGAVRIEVRAAGVNFADVEKRRGTYPDGPAPPYPAGVEVAGVVDAIGAGVGTTGGGVSISTGDGVAALVPAGGYAEYAVAPAETTFALPEGASWGAGAALPVQFLTAHNALFEWGDLERGERVLVTAAAGGVGTAAVQLAAAAGATVVGLASTAEKRALVRDLGAEYAIDYEEADVEAEIEASVGAVDLALDGVGGRAFDDAVAALAPGGRVVSYGMAGGRVPTVATPRLLFENRSVLGYHLTEALDRTPERVLTAVPDLRERFADGEIEAIVDERFPLADAGAAHERLEERESVGKLVLTP